ncbi:MAG: type II toxin-antitoxin system prevent-host-death family antitoxin [Streptosporangiales bacterium]|nr:type II toxin-antitoxin system prevent-host-death family antitoxin [Streptosporangiales bacterium]
MMEEIPVTQARAELADLVNRVAYSGDRIVLTRHGRPLAVLLSPAELERLDAATEAERVPEEDRPLHRSGLTAPPPAPMPQIAEPTRPSYEIAARHDSGPHGRPTWLR